MSDSTPSPSRYTLGGFIFLSRWLQAPLYIGLILAQGVYVYQFFRELIHLIVAAPGISEQEIMMIVLGLIDVVMIANLLVMVIVGGYETFVSRLRLENHPDQPEWLSHVNAGVLKVKLATALIGISSIHLLRTFINIGGTRERVNAEGVITQLAIPGPTSEELLWQVIVHMTFVISALLLAWTDKLSTSTATEARRAHH